MSEEAPWQDSEACRLIRRFGNNLVLVLYEERFWKQLELFYYDKDREGWVFWGVMKNWEEEGLQFEVGSSSTEFHLSQDEIDKIVEETKLLLPFLDVSQSRKPRFVQVYRKLVKRSRIILKKHKRPSRPKKTK